MAPFEPFARDRRVAVAVSGGADSTALALLLQQWGRPEAFVVDHGLRPEAAAEATMAVAQLARFGVAARTLRLRLQPGARSEGARVARYAALARACAAAGLTDLLLGHHAQDQAETVLIRQERGSGPSGLAGMASVVHHNSVRLLRPLLATTPGRLRATVLNAGATWSEDPGNHDLARVRGALRGRFRALGPGFVAAHAASADAAGVQRRHAELAGLAELAATAAIYPEGFAHFQGDVLPSALVWAVSGRAHPPPPAVLARMAPVRPGTLHGVVVTPAGRLGPGWIVAREAAGTPVPAVDGAVWDGRFRLSGQPPPGATIAALGIAPAVRKASGLPGVVLRTMPALWQDGRLAAVPHLLYPDAAACAGLHFRLEPGRPSGPAPFVHMLAGRGCG